MTLIDRCMQICSLKGAERSFPACVVFKADTWNVIPGELSGDKIGCGSNKV